MTTFIGAPLATVNGHAAQGAVYVFTKSKGIWNQIATLTASDGAAGDEFGGGLAISGTIALIGAQCATYNPNIQQCGPGAVYVFTESKGTWSQTQKLTTSDGAPWDEFGSSIALSDTTALIGAWEATVNENLGQGAAYVFTESNGTWTQTQKLTASDGAEGDIFGSAVALSGATALVGAPQIYNFPYPGPGAAYVFTQSDGSWIQTQKLAANDGNAGYEFGIAVALSGATALVGADFAAINGNGGQGAAYVFTESNDTWLQTQKLTAGDGAEADAFGISVSLSGSTALIGAFCATYGSNNQLCGPGAAYLFAEQNGSWSQTQKLTPSDGAAADNFGLSVVLADTTALVGAPCSHYDPATQECGPGAAYIYNESDLGLNVSAPQTVHYGERYTAQTIATNNASAASPAVAVTVVVPAAASFVSATASQGSCSEDSDIVTCNFGAIDGNAGTATVNVTLKAIGDVGTTIENRAGVAKATPSLIASAPTVIEKSNSPPVAEDGTLTTEENTPANGTLEATDPDGDPLTFLIVDKPKHGTVSQEVQGSNAYLYTPNKNYSGSDSFTFKANDGQTDSNVATINITVKAPPPPPPPSGGGGGGATGPLGLGLLALAGLLAFLRRRR